MALQLSQYPYINTEKFALGQIGPGYSWHIDKNVPEAVALAMLPVLTKQIAQRGLLMLVCDAAIAAAPIKAFAAASAAQAILRNYYYRPQPETPAHRNDLSHLLFQAMLMAFKRPTMR
ncbi:MAG: hypothetical protein HC853_11860 [Anaerolineae bacterium]|nr:hypothetical protein [Anaerolineae bacterium]